MIEKTVEKTVEKTNEIDKVDINEFKKIGDVISALPVGLNDGLTNAILVGTPITIAIMTALIIAQYMIIS